MVNSLDSPLQLTPFNELVAKTVTVAVSTVLPVLVAVKPETFPLPEAERPIEVLELDHVNVEFGALSLVKFIPEIKSPLQTVRFVMGLTIGKGLITI